ncbi:MAG: hypothetical protein WC624_03170 [Candidatus Margulisiibacteriota bacterium]
MFKLLRKQARLYQTRFSFGASSAIITNMGLIIGLSHSLNARISIIASILVIALADNISDSFGIHMYQESERLKRREVWLSTSTNFLTRLLVSLTFIALVYLLPFDTVVVASITWGLLLLTFMSYTIAKDEEVNPYFAIAEHLGIAIFVIILSKLVGMLIIR